MSYAPRVTSNTAALASSHATARHASCCKCLSSATHRIRTTGDGSARETAKALAFAISCRTFFGSPSVIAKANPASNIPSHDALGTPWPAAPHMHIQATPRSAPRRPEAVCICKRCRGKCRVGSEHHFLQIAARSPRVGVAARLAPLDRAVLTPTAEPKQRSASFHSQTRRVVLHRVTSGPSVDRSPVPLGPHHSTQSGGPLQPACPCCVSRERGAVECLCAQPVSRAADYSSCPEVHNNQPTHSAFVQSVSVSHQ